MEPTVISAKSCHRHLRQSLHPIEVNAVSIKKEKNKKKNIFQTGRADTGRYMPPGRAA